MVGIQAFPFGAWPIFRGENVSFREGNSSQDEFYQHQPPPAIRPSTAPPTAAPQAPRARPLGVRSAGTQSFVKETNPRKVAMWKHIMVQYLPGSCECLLFWCFKKALSSQKRGHLGSMRNTHPVLNKGKAQDLVEFLLQSSLGNHCWWKRHPPVAWKLPHLPKERSLASGRMLLGASRCHVC